MKTWGHLKNNSEDTGSSIRVNSGGHGAKARKTRQVRLDDVRKGGILKNNVKYPSSSFNHYEKFANFVSSFTHIYLFI